MLRLLLCASLIVPAAAIAADSTAPAAAAQTAEPAKAEKAEKPKRVCTKIRVTGSRLPITECTIVKPRAKAPEAAKTEAGATEHAH